MSDVEAPEVPRTLAEEAEIHEILKKKTGVMVAIPNMGSKMSTPLLMFVQQLAFKTIDSECPWFFKVFMPNDLYPIEWARNQCVRAFLADKYYKKLWFIDSDMNPPFNALDLLDYSNQLVSGMTYIWTSEQFDADGFYKPPYMKINAFDYRPENDDFQSRLPTSDGKVFECDAAGSACLVIGRDILETIPEPWFRTPRDPYGRTLRGEDLDFGLRCMRMGHRTLYVPRVQFGHIKEVDLKHICTYGMASMRTVVEQVSKLPTDKVIAALPKIRFSGERPHPDDAVGDEPSTLRVLEGGKKG